MTLEEAKFEMLNPPMEDSGPSWVERNAGLLAVGAAVAGILMTKPLSIRRFAGAALRSPMARRVVSGLVTGMIARRIPVHT
jgi:hypothetical protein